ncbi:alternate signal-mediated exported protein, RER_14450 family [Georgenia satyanarayanai]|uniref:Alternate signal-mediated exported protein, RER_14450 family n=1 Tax=Georgenia satyanarayanai TaxID=860221 RepID=A0A2Y9A4S8_9MICO|nr:alternate-type signal peptide domain-containing protein [Georgenia satyanarayanai]PYG00986.1 alternate signal-mediated exported protein [Georgenia satyanarayanai]SSA39225.1 alternate signal-mediated exported protein, RER_14450 family [Georgenia satyanarayanai]
MARSTTTSRLASTTWKAVAATAAGVVLLGAGGATFAEWSDSEAAATDTAITSGVLDLAAGEGRWTNVVGADVTAAVADGSYLVVPGDALTYRETMTVDARGDLLRGTVAHNLTGLTGDAELLAQLDANATMSLNGQPVEGSSTTVVAEDEKQDLDVAVTVSFDESTAGLIGQGQSVTLGGLDITLTQARVTGE